jgi:glutamine synthetase
MSVTFMSNLGPGYSSGLHIHHSLQDLQGNPVFVDDNGRTPLMMNWIAGILATMPGATSFLCSTPNACRRMTEFTAPPVTASWGEENKTAGLRLISRTPEIARIEHRLAASDTNPYLALAVILAGGLLGHQHQLQAPPELQTIGWGLPQEVERLPTSLMQSAKALEADKLLAQILGQDVIDYWVNTRKLEWLNFHATGADPDSSDPTSWEFNRYFELI